MNVTNVTLREKELKNGDLSLYLDFYPPIINPQTGKPSRREFLGLYLHAHPKTNLEREHNKTTKAVAQNIHAQRLLAIQMGDLGFMGEGVKNRDFLEYFQELAEARVGSNQDNWKSSYHYLEAFTKGNCKMKDITESFCESYLKYLQTCNSLTASNKKLSTNSIYSYFNKFKAAVREAFETRYLTDNFCKRIQAKQAESQRSFLTMEELNALANTDCNPPLLKQAALFSALTGMRWSDVTQLTWGQLQHSESVGYFVRFVQQKTKGAETLPISEQAVELAGERKEDTIKLFEGLKYSSWMNLRLKQWIVAAGINRDVTFHCFRHTFATLQLSLGTDIFTVSKMLGHRDLKTTQIYTKVMDKSKQEAANKIKINFNKPPKE